MADNGSLMGGQGMGFELLAAALRADMSDTHAFLEALATKLGSALPQRTMVERERHLFRKEQPVRRIQINLGDWLYSVTAQSGGLLAQRAHIVRGIALKTEDMNLDIWLHKLIQSLAALAQRSAQDRAALERLLT
jgi:hypothetical protein